MKNRKWNRILKLADFMEKLPRKRFNFSIWVGHDWRGAPDLSCGTTGCALGWATTLPLFRKLGFRLADTMFGFTVKLNGSSAGLPLRRLHRAFPEGLMGMAQEFGVSPDAFNSLFVPDVYGLPETATPKQWARHARKIVKLLEAGEIS